MSRPQLLSIDDALAIIRAQARPLGSETVPLEAARDRILSEPLIAPLDLPPFTNAAMDGFAVRASDTPGRLRIVGESAAGDPFGRRLAAGEAVRISTGAVLPAGADAIAIVEQVTVDGDVVTVPDAVPFDRHIRHAGSDVRRGTTVFPSGTYVGAAQLGAAAALGAGRLTVGRRPTVAVIPTGSELTAAGQPLAPGGIYDSNGPMLRALLGTAGAEATMLGAPRDSADAVRHALAQALEHDVAITTGGVSVGPHDIVREVAAELGVAELFWGVKLRPGKPLSFGVRTHELRAGGGDRTLVFGIPGNPVSALVCFELFVRPALSLLQGGGRAELPFQQRLLAQDVTPNPERDEMIRVTVDGGGRLTPLSGQLSHQLTVSAQADGLVWIRAGDTVLPAGCTVSYLPI